MQYCSSVSICGMCGHNVAWCCSSVFICAKCFFNLVSNIDVDCCVILLLCCNVAVQYTMTLRNVAAAYQFLVNFVLFTCWLLFCVVAILPCCRWIQDEIGYLHCMMTCHFGIRWVIFIFCLCFWSYSCWCSCCSCVLSQLHTAQCFDFKCTSSG